MQEISQEAGGSEERDTQRDRLDRLEKTHGENSAYATSEVVSVRLSQAELKQLQFIMDTLGIKRRATATRTAIIAYAAVVANMK